MTLFNMVWKQVTWTIISLYFFRTCHDRVTWYRKYSKYQAYYVVWRV